MKIVVLIKEVPDTWGERRLEAATGRVDRRASDAVLDEIGERAIEAALSHHDQSPETEIVVLSMGPSSVSILRRGLAMGATSAVHVVDDRLVGADLGWTAAVLAAAIRRIGFDLVLTGNESTDGRGGVIAAMVAEHLGVPHATAMSSMTISTDAVRGERAGDDETVSIAASLPAVASITERMPDARFPTFKGTMSAKKKPLETLSVADLSTELGDRLEASARSTVIDIRQRPARAAGTKVMDDGSAADRLIDFLAAQRLI